MFLVNICEGIHMELFLRKETYLVQRLDAAWVQRPMVSVCGPLWVLSPASLSPVHESLQGSHQVVEISPQSTDGKDKNRTWFKLESIQRTCRLSFKMGRGDEQKTMMYCHWRKSILFSDLQKCHLSQTMVLSIDMLDVCTSVAHIYWFEINRYTLQKMY